ncbi:PREDICTED: receptor-type tyrosine-protein phosphatase H [Elephantulus edwardii]|uniref:receptor-type tyrosine-protein phosphatase H n=1 Tax=Elephantulus edwardii TaxID=28737 RepID=UPI0003F0902F|nr:PREDICTED: receptor-type tyrosine-protein phosphatase H [Elephantulus edwardii]
MAACQGPLGRPLHRVSLPAHWHQALFLSKVGIEMVQPPSVGRSGHVARDTAPPRLATLRKPLPFVDLRFCAADVRDSKPVINIELEDRNTSSITLNWTASLNLNQTLDSYRIQWSKGDSLLGTQETSDTRVTVTGLEAGTSYTFTLWVERNGIDITDEKINASTVPNAVPSVEVQGRSTTSITLAWTAPQGPEQPPYTYWVQWSRGDSLQGNQSTSDTWVTVEELEPGTLYSFAVWVQRNDVNSVKVTTDVSTVPNAVPRLEVQDRNTTAITLAWAAPQGPEEPPYTYWVQWSRGDSLQGNQSTSDTWVTVKELEPGTLYSFAVWVWRNDVNSTSVAIDTSTVPNTVPSLEVQDRNTTSITLAWTAPQGPEQPPYTYEVQWSKKEDSQQHREGTSDTIIVIKELHSGTLYFFTVCAQRNGVRSDARDLTEATVPNEVTELQNTSQTNSSVTLHWKPPADPYPQSYVYWVQWASGGQSQRATHPQGDEINQTVKTNETQCVVKALLPGTLYDFTVWAEMNNVSSSTQSLRASTVPDPVTITSCVSISSGYGVSLTWSCPLGGYEAFKLEVDGQQVVQDKSSCGKDIPLSGLQPARSYLATVTTMWEGMSAPAASVTCHTESAGVIAGAVVGVLLLLVLVGLLVFFLRKRKEKNQEKAALWDLAFSFPEDISAEDFADHVRRNEKDSHCGFAEEYQQLTLEGHNQPQTVASAPENNAKNRYRNVLPYDWSRVPLKSLQGEPGSDYINASFIPGLWNPQEFIAAQGPLPQTVGDFWRLVWEQQSHTLVMLTNCMESGRVKCEHYWPLDSQPCTHGHLQVTLVDEEVTEDWTIRNLKVFNMDEQKTLSVRQFHYVAWPDHGVPHSPDPLLAFWKVLRKWLDQKVGDGPAIVHCSAGVGRTGTLIALDVLLRQLETEGVVGPFSFVKKMRASRPLMVQTESQYVFLHHCILRFLQQSSTAPAEESTNGDVGDLIYENIAVVKTQEQQASTATTDSAPLPPACEGGVRAGLAPRCLPGGSVLRAGRNRWDLPCLSPILALIPGGASGLERECKRGTERGSRKAGARNREKGIETGVEADKDGRGGGEGKERSWDTTTGRGGTRACPFRLQEWEEGGELSLSFQGQMWKGEPDVMHGQTDERTTD